MPELVTNPIWPFTLGTGAGLIPLAIEDAVKWVWRARHWELTLDIHVRVVLDNGEDPPIILEDDFNESFGPVAAEGIEDESDLPCGFRFNLPFSATVSGGPVDWAIYGEAVVFNPDETDPISQDAGLYYPNITFGGQIGYDCTGIDCTPGPNFGLTATPNSDNTVHIGEPAGGATLYLEIDEIGISTTTITGTVSIDIVDYWGYGGVVDTATGDALIPAQTDVSYYFQCPCP